MNYKKLEDDLKMLDGLPPYNGPTNICLHDAYFAKAIEREHGAPIAQLRLFLTRRTGTSRTLFGYIESRRRKTEGMQRAAGAHIDLLNYARRLAVRVALGRDNRVATADDVAQALEEQGYPQLGPEAGSLFKTRDWLFTGNRIQSERIKNHSAEIKVWRYIGRTVGVVQCKQ